MLAESGYDCLKRLDGLETLRKINKGGYDIPVIMVTGYGSETVAAEAIKMGAYDYIVKAGSYLAMLPIITIKACESHGRDIENVALKKNIEKNYLDTLAILISVIEEKDYYTRGRFLRRHDKCPCLPRGSASRKSSN